MNLKKQNKKFRLTIYDTLNNIHKVVTDEKQFVSTTKLYNLFDFNVIEK